MTTTELHKMKSLNRQDIRNIGFYSGEQNAFQILSLSVSEKSHIGLQRERGALKKDIYTLTARQPK